MPIAFALFAFALLLLSPLAFWPMYFSKDWSGIDRYTHTHALFGALWLVVLLVQPLLMLRGRRIAHRMIGRASLFVAFGFVVSGALLAHFRLGRMPEDVFASEGALAYLPLAVAALFAVACILGFRWRRSAAVHARFMVTTALLLLDPLLARIMYFYLPPMPSTALYQGVTFAMIAAALAWLAGSLPAKAIGRTWFRNYAIGAVSTLGLFFVVPRMSAWLVVVRWFRDLPLT